MSASTSKSTSDPFPVKLLADDTRRQCSKEQDFAEEIKKATDGAGVDVIVDFVGQGYFAQNLSSAAKDGRMVMLGLLSGAKTSGPVDLSQLLYKRMRIEGTVSASDYRAD